MSHEDHLLQIQASIQKQAEGLSREDRLRLLTDAEKWIGERIEAAEENTD